jgi:excisionase family DNA binding protein
MLRAASDNRNGAEHEERVVLGALRFPLQLEPTSEASGDLVGVSRCGEEDVVSASLPVLVEWETADHLIEQLKARCEELKGEIQDLRARMDSPLYTRQEAADFLRVCTGTIDREIASGRLPRVVIRGAVRVPKDSVRSLIGLS